MRIFKLNYAGLILLLGICFFSISSLALPMANCKALIGTSWSGKLFDANTGQFIQDINVTVNNVATNPVNGRYAFTGSGFVNDPKFSSCAESQGVVSDISFGFVVNEKVAFMWDDYPSDGFIEFKSDSDVEGFLSK